ncbi:MBL fold metallo-hydrolase [Myxococcota bacterium]|nr:MBL fold metallo-hydrolase [Myxococcota bacterium]
MVLPLLVLLWSCAARGPASPPEAAVRADAELHPDLVAQSALLRRQVLEPAEGVYVAVGFGLANIIFLEGPTGVVVIDAGEGRAPATEALAALRERTDKPLSALVLTHNHADHVMGGQVFVEAGPPEMPVWAHETTEVRVDEVVHVLREATWLRGQRMFGALLPPERETGDGIGMRLRFATEDIALARPTHTLAEAAVVEAGGLRVELLHAPGETDDQVIAWLPDRRILLPADNVYQAFPNLYTIRGTPPRDPLAWVDSLDRMRDLRPDLLVPQHTLPVLGQEAVQDVLTAWRDAIQFVHDQTVRGMNAGRTPDELAATITLPPHLAAHPWLAEHYGRVPWCVRGVYDGYLGWFDGRASTLEPLPPQERARRYQAAFQAGLPLADQVQAALDLGEWAWAAELAQLLVDADPQDRQARALLARALDGLARGHVNANAVNWYRTEALELRGEVTARVSPPDAAPLDLVDGLPLHAFMAAIPTRLQAEEVQEVDWRALFHFTEEEPSQAEAWYSLHVRRGVAELRRRDAQQAAAWREERAPDLVVTTSARTWKRVASGHEGAVGALASGRLRLEGGIDELLRLQGWLER